jgi:hypothetical protein
LSTPSTITLPIVRTSVPSSLLLPPAETLSAALSLRLVGIIIILAFLGASLAILELFPHPDFLNRHASFLNTYYGRSALYLAIALISADSIEVKKDHKWKMYMTWLSAGSLVATSAFFFAIGTYSLLWKPLPVSRSMTTSAEAAKYHATTSRTDVFGMSSNAKDTTTGSKNNKGDSKAGQQASDIETPYGDPFDQGALGRSGWTETALPDHSSKVPLSSLKIKPDWLDYSIDMSTSSYAHQVATTDSRLQWIKSEISPTTPDEESQRAKHEVVKRLSNSPSRRTMFNKEASSSRDQLIPTRASEKHNSKAGNRVTFQNHSSLRNETQGNVEWTTFTTSHDDVDDDRDKARNHLSKEAKRRSSHHKRVFVPGIGSFDLSSGSDDSEGEQEEVAHRTIQADSDNSSIYSVDSDIGMDQRQEGGEPRLGRKLTRKETLTYRGKLNRGMQRALSQRQGQQRSAGNHPGSFI